MLAHDLYTIITIIFVMIGASGLPHGLGRGNDGLIYVASLLTLGLCCIMAAQSWDSTFTGALRQVCLILCPSSIYFANWKSRQWELEKELKPTEPKSNPEPPPAPDTFAEAKIQAD